MTAPQGSPAWSGEGVAPTGLSSVVPSGFVLPRGFVEGIIRKDETSFGPRRGLPHARVQMRRRAAPLGRLARTGGWRRAKGCRQTRPCGRARHGPRPPTSTSCPRPREGSAEAFGELWRRHLPGCVCRRRASSRPLGPRGHRRRGRRARPRADPRGKGPDEHFRAYFLSAVRTVAIDQGRRDLRVVPTEADDLEELAEPGSTTPSRASRPTTRGSRSCARPSPGSRSATSACSGTRPSRVRRPRAVAPALGMTANAVSVRAMRARESLRALYLDARAERGLGRGRHRRVPLDRDPPRRPRPRTPAEAADRARRGARRRVPARRAHRRGPPRHPRRLPGPRRAARARRGSRDSGLRHGRVPSPRSRRVPVRPPTAGTARRRGSVG